MNEGDRVCIKGMLDHTGTLLEVNPDDTLCIEWDWGTVNPKVLPEDVEEL